MDHIHSLLEQTPPKLRQRFIADAVDSTIRRLFPIKYAGLCHIYAILGSNVLSIALNRHYAPVGGIGIIDAGKGCFLEMLDNAAFSREQGGSFHCWIESSDTAEKELVDFAYRHNATYAESQGIRWRAKRKAYLWGAKKDIILDMDKSQLPKAFPDGKVWFRETDEGAAFLKKHITSHLNEHVNVTNIALRQLALELETFVGKRERQH